MLENVGDSELETCENGYKFERTVVGRSDGMLVQGERARPSTTLLIKIERVFPPITDEERKEYIPM